MERSACREWWGCIQVGFYGKNVYIGVKDLSVTCNT